MKPRTLLGTHVERIIVAAVGAGLATLVACGSTDDDSTFTGGDAGPSGSSGAATSGGGSSSGFGTGDAAPNDARGVVLVHAASLRAFRVCFENYPDIAPQPDSKVMPESNTPGVEIGSAVRIGAITKVPGKVYVIPTSELVSTPDLSCKKVLQQKTINSDYLVAGDIETEVGVTGADALIVSGCGNASLISALPGVTEAECFANGGAGTGTLKTHVVRLAVTTGATPTTLPVELYNASERLVALKPEGTALDVTYGGFEEAGAGAPLATPVAADFTLYEASATPNVLGVDQTQLGTFATHGFRIAYRRDGGATDPDGGLFSTDQTLAAVQELSRPLTTPTSFFTGNTNFALILLGDPRITRSYSDGGANPNFDGRRAVHLLAVPVRDELDAGPLGDVPTVEPDAGPTDAGAGQR